MRPGQGLIVADGLQGKPIVNASGCFVWLEEDLNQLQKVSVDPGTLPYEKVEWERSRLKLPPDITTIELPPRVDYAFTPGITGLRGRLIETQVTPPQPATPVPKAAVHLQWLDENGLWQDVTTISHSNENGDFVTILRLALTEAPPLDPNGFVTVRLSVSRDGGTEFHSNHLKILQGRVTDPTTLEPLTFAWDEFQP
ncbi:MAG: hypothetical protein HOP19_25575, partial [Acidobacteria bacterium]|nr:hypothetical protein [Acidobacteriota bacterium]